MADEAQLRDLKERVDDLQRIVDHASGALEHVMQNLQRDFGCDNLKEARRLLEQLEQQCTDQKEEFDKKYNEFVGAYGPQLGYPTT